MRSDRGKLCAAVALTSLLTVCAAGSAHAQEASAADQILAEIAALRQQQAQITAMQQATSARLATLEARLANQPAPTPSVTSAAPPPQSPAAVQRASAPSSPKLGERLKVSGDLRVRLQGDEPATGRDRLSGQVRARLGAVYKATDQISIGARLTTGDPEDPNSADAQLSDFTDDLQVNLDQAYMRGDFGKLTLFGGKIPQPFVRTELLWDTEVNPEGVAAQYKQPLTKDIALRATAMFSVVDEQATQDDTTMLGVQLGIEETAGKFRYEAHLAYYDYTTGGLGGGDIGDFRTNLRGPDGLYLSDFNLADVTFAATWTGLSPNWPVRVSGDFVRNMGAVNNEDEGYGVDIAVGQTAHAGDWKFTLGRMRAETDAVFAAYSQDLTPIGTNYALNILQFDHMLRDRIQLTGMLYRYRSLSGGPDASRMRLSIAAMF